VFVKIAIGISSAGTIGDEASFTLARMAYHQGVKGRDLQLVGVTGPYIEDNYNKIYHTVQEMACDCLFLMETDMQYMLAADVLGYMIDQNRDVLSGVYYQGSYPYRPIIYDFTEEGLIRNYAEIPNGQFRVEATGTGWLLLGKKVINLFTPQVIEELGEPFEFLHDGVRVKLRHDAAFFWRLKKLGIEVWADSDIPLRHIKRHQISPSHFETARGIILNGGISGNSGGA
jgi:hypothetical protein